MSNSSNKKRITHTKTMKKNKKSSVIVIPQYREDAISWVLHSVKNVLGYEDNRKMVLQRFIPILPNIEHVRTFEATIEYKEGNKKDYDKKYEKKIDELQNYCREVMQFDDYVVFTATNIEEFREDERDLETHYQMFIVDNKNRKLYVIDPAIKNGKTYGIYIPQVAVEIIMPFFKENGFKTQFVKLKYPAQTNNSEENADIFCQSWSLYILIEFLKDNENLENVTINIPRSQEERYDILLHFYKELFSSISTLQSDLKKEFVSEVERYNLENASKIKKVNPNALLMDMRTNEMS